MQSKGPSAQNHIKMHTKRSLGAESMHLYMGLASLGDRMRVFCTGPASLISESMQFCLGPLILGARMRVSYVGWARLGSIEYRV